MKVRSDYTYRIEEADGLRVLIIIDLDRGDMSVTNNIETVMELIAEDLGKEIYTQPIIYRDSMGIFDGIDGNYMRDPFYGIGITNEDTAIRIAAYRYWEQNTIHISRDRAWKRSYKSRESGEVIRVPDKLRQIQEIWIKGQTETGDKGSCVIGAGFEFDFDGQRYFMSPAGSCHGSGSWEPYKDKVNELLMEAGVTNIKYHWGIMD